MDLDVDDFRCGHLCSALIKRLDFCEHKAGRTLVDMNSLYGIMGHYL